MHYSTSPCFQWHFSEEVFLKFLLIELKSVKNTDIINFVIMLNAEDVVILGKKNCFEICFIIFSVISESNCASNSIFCICFLLMLFF